MLTLIQMPLELVELALLQADLEVDDMARGRRADLLPLSGHAMRVLDGVGRAGVEW
jgi:hypothetical protein